ncbi:hypothetical protein B0T24DRAFT_602989 [Lasiosphaeria ovina]|uniref:Uncharacterized protein n=1 Tax=Lasiosphaeria ovina TaxID=92902 RepID=A0AAE0NJX5_9PEZI|nr:hypothetical protein B0T24DRAFT_602989 [Lasiosphaeria ovina]
MCIQVSPFFGIFSISIFFKVYALLFFLFPARFSVLLASSLPKPSTPMPLKPPSNLSTRCLAGRTSNIPTL